jgi:hypothetical protein
LNEPAAKYDATRRLIRSFRLNEAHLRLITAECARRRIPFSEFVRQSLLGNLRYMKRDAIALWGQSAP